MIKRNKRMKRPLTPFGKAVRRGLEESNMTQRQLAEAVGISPQYITQIIRGDRKATNYKPFIVTVLDLPRAWISEDN